MALHEFALIERYFKRYTSRGQGVVLGVGDDGAVLQLPGDEEIIVSTDTLLEGVHFPALSSPGKIAGRALRVNLSDLAAMGARPKWFLLALTLPDVDENWLAEFSAGLSKVADEFECPLVGGDTTRGQLSITITAIGSSPAGSVLARSGAHVGDSVWVTGSLGDAAAGLAVLEGQVVAGDTENLINKFWQPCPRIQEGLIMRDIASAVIDVSDGLLADLGHLVNSSGVGVDLNIDLLPLSPPLVAAVGKKTATAWALGAGDDYELCFTISPHNAAVLDKYIDEGQLMATHIGQIVAGDGVVCKDAWGRVHDPIVSGYRHF
jgi:thiamine-monophosphate kinase